MKNYISILFLAGCLGSCTTLAWDRNEPELLQVLTLQNQSSVEVVKIFSTPEYSKIYSDFWQSSLESVFIIQLPEQAPLDLKFQTKLATMSGANQWRDILWTGFPEVLDYPNKGVFGNSSVPALLFTSGSGEDTITVQMTYTFAPYFVIQWEALTAHLLTDQKQVFQFLDAENHLLGELAGTRLRVAESLEPEQYRRVLLIAAITRAQQLLARKTLE